MKKRPTISRLSNSRVVVDVWQRELGHLPATSFTHRLIVSQDFLLRLDVYRKLEEHRGCVNTVSFNTNGEVLCSASDDKKVIFWDWENGCVKLSFDSGHTNNVFQAKIMPNTHDQEIITCGADGQIRHAKVLQGGKAETKLLGKHQGRAHMLAIEPDNPHIFYSCGEDGLVQHCDLRRGATTELFYCQPVHNRKNMQVAHLNTIALDPWNPFSLAAAGSDEYTRLYDIRKYCIPTDYFCPTHLIGNERVGVSSLAFSNQRELLVSYNGENIYLFTRDMGLIMNNDGIIRGAQVYAGHRNCVTVKGVSFFGSNCEYIMSGSDCGRIFIWKKKGGQLIRVMNGDKYVVNCIQAHPYATVLASSGIENDVKIWTPIALHKATLPNKVN